MYHRSPILNRLYLLCFLLLFPLVLNAQIIYVKANATGNNDGTSWANAYTSLNTALQAAGSGSQLWVAAGTYKPANNRDAAFVINSGVKLYGGFAGTETTLGARNPILNQTILSGDITGTNCYHVVVLVNCDSATLLDGFTIRDGYADVNDSLLINGARISKMKGAGIYIHRGSPRIINCTINANLARYGGGIYTIGDTSYCFKDTFINNQASFDGGAVMLMSSYALLDSCRFAQNAASTFSGTGGGFFSDGGGVTVRNSYFTGNTARQAAAMFNANGNINIEGCTMYNNTGFQDSYGTSGAGGIGNYRVMGRISRCKIRRNVSYGANYYGECGGVNNDDCKGLSFISCVIDSNVATVSGFSSTCGYNGGMTNKRSTITMYNCIVRDNLSTYKNGIHGFTYPGDIYNLNSVVTYSNCTIASNYANTDNIHMFNDASSTIKFYNSIFWTDNVNTLSTDATSTFYAHNCIIQNSAVIPVNKISNSNPLFTNPAIGDYSLSKCSPAINAGDTFWYPTSASSDKDLLFNNRLRHRLIDLGAIESPYANADISSMLADTIATCALSSTQLIITSYGDSLSYRWQIKKDSLSSFRDTSLANIDTLHIDSPSVSMNGWKFRVIVKSCNGVSDTSNVATLIVNPLPTPVVLNNGMMLSTGNYSAYQWYRDSVLITGAVSDTFAFSSNGNYYVYVTDTNGCGGYSASVAVTGVGIDEVHANNVIVFPNPAKDYLHIKGMRAKDIVLYITDVMGKTLLESHSQTTYIGSLPSGVYYYVLRNSQQALVKRDKLVKM